MTLLDRFRGNGHPKTTDLSIDELAGLIRNERRRAVIRLLDGEPMELRELATDIATAEFGSEPTSEEYRRIYIGLYQTYIPTLSDAGIVIQDDLTVGPGPNHAAARDAIEALEGYTEVDA